MSEVRHDTESFLRVVTELSAASATYYRHFVLWLGIGAAGGIAALLSFASEAPDTDFTLRLLLPSLTAFMIALVGAAASVFAMSRRESCGAIHHGSALNREQLHQAIAKTPEWLSSSTEQAKEMNRRRDILIAKNKDEHDQAERAWVERSNWHAVVQICVTISALAFLVGAALPIVHIASGKRLASPPAAADKK